MRAGEIAPGDVIAEATSGNTGIRSRPSGARSATRCASTCRLDVTRAVLVIQSLGAAVIPVSAELGGFLGSIRMADDFAREAGHVFRPQQFDNTANVQAHYETTGPRSPRSSARLGRTPTAFVAGVGTGRHRDGRGAAPAGALRTRRAGPPARAGEFTDAADRPQGRPSPHPGNQRRVRARPS
jgi:cysteine synthase A